MPLLPPCSSTAPCVGVHAENYTETIHGSFDVEISSPYLMYTLGDGMVRDERAVQPHPKTRRATLSQELKIEC